MMSRRTCFLPGPCRCVLVLRAAWRLPPGGPPASFGFLLRRGAAILTTTHIPLPLSAFSVSYFVFLFFSLLTPLQHFPAFANSPSRSPHIFFSFFRPGTPPRLCAIPFCSVLSFLPPFEENENLSATNHGGCFASSANRGRASVLLAGNAGPISPRISRGALLTLAGVLRSCHSFRGEQVAYLRFPLARRCNSRGGGGGCAARGALGLAAAGLRASTFYGQWRQYIFLFLRIYVIGLYRLRLRRLFTSFTAEEVFLCL
jgi:hypothetical protein